jgi:hypothetical protein
MLRKYYGDTTLQGDIVRRGSTVDEQGLHTTIYNESTVYPFSESLLVFNFGQRKVWRLTDLDSARRYFATFDPEYGGGCPEGTEGQGVRIF